MAVVATVIVGYTTHRPVIPDENHSLVIVAADTELDAELLALQMVASRRGVEMVTSSKISYAP